MGIFKKAKKTDETAVEEKAAKKPAAKKAPAKAKAQKAKKEEAPATEEKTVVAKAETESSPIITKSTNVVLVRPVVTEKAASAQSTNNKYTFIVAHWAKKAAVKAAVKAVYGVEPVAVNIINVEGHRMRFGKNEGKRSDFKKAIVTLPEGKTITVHEGV